MRTTSEYFEKLADEKAAFADSCRPVSGQELSLQPKTCDHRIGGILSPRSAFSLVEVVIAIGIISFSLVAVMGLIPVGLTAMQQAMDDTMVAQIFKQVSGEVLLTPFSELSTKFGNARFFYNDQGIKENSAGLVRYWVSTSLVNPSYPGSSNAPPGRPITDSLAAVRVNIVTASSVDAVIKNTNFYNLRVPNSGN